MYRPIPLLSTVRARRGQARVDAAPAVCERVERGRRGQLAAVNREAQAVAGHRIDEAGRVAGEQQTVDRGRRDVDGERPEDDGRHGEAGGGGAVGEQRVARKFAKQERGRVGELGVSGAGRSDEADVGQPTRHRRDADVVIATDVHLANNGGR